MSETTMKWYQFLLKETETDLFHTLRSIEQDGVPPTRNEVNKLRQTLDLLGYAGDQCLGRYHVDGSNLILECAKIGAVIRHKILGGDWDKRATHDADEDPADEPDAVLDTQPADTVGKAFSDDEPISWDDVKEEVIPSYVKTVTFTIAEAEITPSRRKELEERFPGVAIQVVSPALVSAKVGKPKGIKSATFELDRLELDNDPALQTSIGNQFPWATIRPEPVASISSSEAPVSATTTEPHISLHLAHDLPGHTKKGPVVRRESVDASSEATDTSPRPSPRNRSAIQRETPGRARPATGIVQAAADEDEQEDNRQSKLDESIQSVPKGPKGHESADETIKAVARQIGLEMAHPDVICGMYSQYSRTKQIRPFVPKLYKLDHYYSNLVDLSIIANKKRMAPLEYALLLKFQCTNYQYQRQIPEIPIAIKAFQYLPIRSPLCRWMTILYSFLWGTEDEGDYDAFCASYEGLDQAALARFLFGVARVRCPFTTGLDAAVLKRWCDVHSHAPGSEEERLCKETISKSKVSIDDATRDEERLRLKEAEATINELGGTVIMPPQGASTSGPGKRKYEGAANSRFSKKNKRGGGLGLGR
ncbi:hypothetical protein BU26DRAFT_518469 [Trematosphaeria pertusa]|uniref:Uncharacterized protein n=1 Tax=Trematosphaeria pertusa TaxID=390896 RepID=A0A6A6IHV4_9PLEO|nr:uncharacterized protein BU26DRAFT_518469 [Trematosphaeria pertusa]KAF2249991.1 hypothetical protein BU26DRAFT_518469 [Trematosphaeria pertusa]